MVALLGTKTKQRAVKLATNRRVSVSALIADLIERLPEPSVSSRASSRAS